MRASNFNLYVQDSYKATSRLTLNIGLRYELPQPYSEIHNQDALFVPNAQSRVHADRSSGPAVSGRPGRGAGLDSEGIPRLCSARGLRLGSRQETGGGRCGAAYGIFYDPYYNGEGGPLQAPESAATLVQDDSGIVSLQLCRPAAGRGQSLCAQLSRAGRNR